MCVCVRVCMCVCVCVCVCVCDGLGFMCGLSNDNYCYTSFFISFVLTYVLKCFITFISSFFIRLGVIFCVYK